MVAACLRHAWHPPVVRYLGRCHSTKSGRDRWRWVERCEGHTDMQFSLDDGPRPRQQGRFLGLWDGPLYRDWLFWLGGTCTAVVALSVAFPPASYASSLPRWLDATLAALTTFGFFAFLPAYLRLRIRRFRRRRLRATSQVAAGRVAAPPPVPEERASRAETERVSTPQAPSGSESAATATLNNVLTPEEQAPAKAFPLPGAAAPPAGMLGSKQGAAPKSGDGPSVLTASRQTLPYPVARAARAVQLSTDPMDVYRAVLRCAEATCIVLGVTSVAWARHYGVVTKELTALQGAYLDRGVSQGHWLTAARSLERPMSTHEAAPPRLAEALRPRKGGGLLTDLEELLQERNRAAHGAEPHNRLEAADRNHLLVPVLERALMAASFLRNIEWVITRNSQFRRRQGKFEVSAYRAMSDHPDFELVNFITDQPLADDIFYARTPVATIDLTPLIVLRNCPVCRQAEVAHADRLDPKKGVSLKTFDRGHPLFDAALSDEVRTLLGGPEAAGTGA